MVRAEFDAKERYSAGSGERFRVFLNFGKVRRGGSLIPLLGRSAQGNLVSDLSGSISL